MEFTSQLIRAQGRYIGITQNADSACCQNDTEGRALPLESLNAVDILLPGMDKG